MSLPHQIAYLCDTHPQCGTVGAGSPALNGHHIMAFGIDWQYWPDQPGSPDYLEHQVPLRDGTGRSAIVRVFPDGIGGYVILRHDPRETLRSAVQSGLRPTLAEALAYGADRAEDLRQPRPVPEAA